MSGLIDVLWGAVSLGLLWAVMTIGVYITYRILDIADLTVEGSIATGAAVAAQCIVMAGGHTGAFTYFAGGSLLVAGILVLIILPKTGGKVGDPSGKKG